MAADRPRLETRLRSAFGVKRIPFGKDLEPDELFLTDSFTQSTDRLRYLLDRRGIGAVFGALAFRTIGDLLFVFDFEPLWQPLFQGVVLLLAVSLGALALVQVKNRLEWFR